MAAQHFIFAALGPLFANLLDILAANPILLLFTIIGLGYLIGNIKILGFKLGVAAVLFVGMAFGALDERLMLPDYIYVIGLVLFVYAIGIQSGTGFFSSFRKRGLKLNIVAVVVLCAGALVTVILKSVMGLSAPSAAGLFCGALTNTPALAATVETIGNMKAAIPPSELKLYLGSPVVTYGLAYPIGVLGVIIWFFIFTRLFKINFAREEAQRLKESGTGTILSKTFRITNPAIVGKTVEEALGILGETGFALSRIQKGDVISVVVPSTILSKGDLVVAVGGGDQLERARILFGEQSAEHLPETAGQIAYRRIFVSNKNVIGKTIRELELHKVFDATITRLRRGDVDFVPTSDTILESGDRIRVVASRGKLEAVSKFFGDSIRSISETDFLSLSLGIVLGVFLGMIAFPLPRGMVFRFGFAGGPLIVGLILGKLERTGPIIWGLPYTANLVLRQVGLVFFLAAIGTKAGPGFGTTFETGGWGLIAAGAAITSLVAVAGILAGYKFLKLPMSAVMGVVSGMHTQPACLAYATQQASNELPNIWYAAVYPASMIAKIILAQILVSILLM
ncbi:MAG: TrkA C-terminal domain-containing protein [Candidatus Krumholzibacteria bacterium]|nr:TrkA C-terminal domain-containing protein [Candidatus Krumholzibacteria bacterium]